MSRIAPDTDREIRLPDSRRLAYATWGDPQGRPVLFFHGMPSSRLQFPDPSAASELGVRVITVDRPGSGRSDPQPGHRIADWTADVLGLADALGLDRFGVVGWSAGAPYALACAALIPDRLTGAAITTSASGMTYLYDEPEIFEALADDDDRATLAALEGGVSAAERHAAETGEDWVRDVAERPEDLFDPIDRGDEWFFADPDLYANALESARDGVRQGAAALAPQWVGLLAPWGFRLEDITVRVHVWAGANDVTRPVAYMHLLADRIPDHVITVWDDVGHFGIARHMRDVLAEL